MSSNVIRVGVVGAGGNTKDKHIPLLQAIDGVEIVSVCNRSQASGQAVADQFQIPSVFTDWHQLVQSTEIDAVVIGTWPNMHKEITIAALEAGKHVMVEARIARNANEAAAMLAASEARPQLICQVVPAPFTFAVDKTVKRLLTENYIGEVLAADIRFAGQQFLDKDAPLSWRQDRDISGNNILALGICYESIMRWLGCADTVIAHGSTFVTQRKNSNGDLVSTDIPEHLDVIASINKNIHAHFRMSAISGFAAENEFRIIGSTGTLIVRGDQLFAAQKGDDALHEISIPENERGDWRVEEEFINAIRGKERITHTSFADGLRYMHFTDAVTNSLREGNRQHIET